MAKEDLQALAKEHGTDLDPGADGIKRRESTKKNVKIMSKKELMAETAKLRKQVRSIEDEAAAAKAAEGAVLAVVPELLGELPGCIYDMAADKYGNHWRLTDREKTMWGTALNAMLDRYLPDLQGSHPELVTLIIVASLSTVPRAMMTIRMRQSGMTGGEKTNAKE